MYVEIMQRAADRMKDPECRAFHPLAHVFEDDEGLERHSVDGPTRGCFYGNFYLAAKELGKTRNEADMALFRTVEPEIRMTRRGRVSAAHDRATRIVAQQGWDGCIKMTEEAIEREKALA